MRTDVAAWLAHRTYRAGAFDAVHVLDLKRRRGSTVSVVLPALDEERTGGAIVDAIRGGLVERVPLVDEVVVVDSGSSDRAARVAAAAGARVVHVSDVLPDRGTVPGKGEALWKSLHATDGDLLVFVDSDLVDFDPYFVV